MLVVFAGRCARGIKPKQGKASGASVNTGWQWYEGVIAHEARQIKLSIFGELIRGVWCYFLCL